MKAHTVKNEVSIITVDYSIFKVVMVILLALVVIFYCTVLFLAN